MDKSEVVVAAANCRIAFIIDKKHSQTKLHEYIESRSLSETIAPSMAWEV